VLSFSKDPCPLSPPVALFVAIPSWLPSEDDFSLSVCLVILSCNQCQRIRVKARGALPMGRVEIGDWSLALGPYLDLA
jgi:hypothetical protein